MPPVRPHSTHPLLKGIYEKGQKDFVGMRESADFRDEPTMSSVIYPVSLGEGVMGEEPVLEVERAWFLDHSERRARPEIERICLAGTNPRGLEPITAEPFSFIEDGESAMRN